MEITLMLTLTGTRPMLQHNGRLANPLDEHTIQLRALTAKRRKTDEDLNAIARAEARGAAYETDDGLLGLPTRNVWRSIKDAATAFKRGKDIERALSFAPVVEPLLLNGEHVKVEDFVSRAENVLYESVVVNRARTMRCRPCVPTGWQSTHTLWLLTEVMDPADLGPILDRAGRLVGVGDWRPVYGTYTATATVV